MTDLSKPCTCQTCNICGRHLDCNPFPPYRPRTFRFLWFVIEF